MLPNTRPSPAVLAALSLLPAIAPLAHAAQETGNEKPQTEQREQEAEPRSAAEILEDVERLRLEHVTASLPAEELLPRANALMTECRRGMEGLQPEHSKARALAEPLFQAHVLRVELLLAMGLHDEAKSEIEALGAEDAKREARSAELAKARAALARQSGPAASDRTAQDASAVAKDALERGDLRLLRELGAIAIPALKEWIAAHPQHFTSTSGDDPLALLVDLDRRGSGAFVLQHYDRGDYLWRKRIARVLMHKDVLQFSTDWTGSEVPKESHLPEWLEVLERLVEDPDLGAEVIPKLQFVIQHRGVTPRLQAAMTAILAVDDARRDAVRQLIRRGGDYGEDMRPVLESAVAHPDAATRISAAGALLDYEESDALLARAADPDATVRETVANGFVSRRLFGGEDQYLPRLDDRRREILVQLTRDESAKVRSMAMHAVLDHAASLDDSVLDPYTRDQDAEVRAAFIGFLGQHVPLERWARFATAMANDPDERVIQSIDVQIWTSVQNRRIAGILDLLDARMRSTRHPWRSRVDEREVGFYLLQLAKIPEGRNRLARLAIEWSDEQLLRATFDEEALFELAPELLQDYVQRVFASDLGAVVEMTKEVFRPDDEDAASRDAVARELVALAGDTSLDPRLRLILASAAPAEASDLVVDTTIATFTDPRWKPGGEWGDPTWLADLASERLEELSDGDLNRIVVGTLSHEGTEPALRRIVGELLRPLASDGRDAVRLVLASMLDDPAASEGVWRAVESLGSVEHPDGAEILRTVVAEGRYVDAAAGAMARSRDARFIPDLAKILVDPRIRGEWNGALQALASFLTDEAAEALLNVSAQITDTERRAAVLKAVEDIRTYQEARERWSSRRVAQRTREQATTELLGMLSHSDPQIRGEAARGLATLGAVEAIPQLIGLLRDASPEVQASARAALDRLHRRAEIEEVDPATGGAEPPAAKSGATDEDAGTKDDDDGE